MAIIAKCAYDPEVYCNNWDGKGNIYDLKTLPPANANGCVDLDGQFKDRCPTEHKTCQFKVIPTPAPELKAG